MRAVVVQLWSGLQVVHRLPFAAADVDLMTDNEVTGHLRALGLNVPATAVERAARREFPTLADLDAIATQMVAWNDGVGPVARVLEEATIPSGRGAAGSVPR